MAKATRRMLRKRQAVEGERRGWGGRAGHARKGTTGRGPHAKRWGGGEREGRGPTIHEALGAGAALRETSHAACPCDRPPASSSESAAHGAPDSNASRDPCATLAPPLCDACATLALRLGVSSPRGSISRGRWAHRDDARRPAEGTRGARSRESRGRGGGLALPAAVASARPVGASCRKQNRGRKTRRCFAPRARGPLDRADGHMVRDAPAPTLSLARCIETCEASCWSAPLL